MVEGAVVVLSAIPLVILLGTIVWIGTNVGRIRKAVEQRPSGEG